MSVVPAASWKAACELKSLHPTLLSPLFSYSALTGIANVVCPKGSRAAVTAEVGIAWTPTFDCAATLWALVESGMITQQQLRTSPVVAKIISLVILFLELHKLEICFPQLALSPGCGACFRFINLFHPYKDLT